MGLNVSTGPDGISVPGVGWTNQSSTYNTNKSLESYGAAASTIINPALRKGYSAWAYDPLLVTATGLSIATTSTASLVYVPESFVLANVDWINVTGTANITIGVWPSTAPAGTATPLCFVNAQAATAGAVNTAAISSGPTLVGGNSYFVTIYGSTTDTVGVTPAGTTYSMNTGYVGTTAYSITTSYVAGTVGTIAGTLSAASVFGTSTLITQQVWFGLH